MPSTPKPFEAEFVSGLKEIFEQRVVFNRVLGLRIDTVAGDGVSAAPAPINPSTYRTSSPRPLTKT